MKKLFRFLPNTLTMGNLAAGVSGLYFLAQGEVINASWMILLAGLFDVLDGLVARAVNAVSVIGKDLDSLADLVSFGVLPGAIVAWFIKDSGGDEWMAWLAIILVPVATAYRLARFNNDPEQSTSFLGLPAPANGLLLGTWALGIAYGKNLGLTLLLQLTAEPAFVLGLALLSAFLMVSKLPLLSFKIKERREKANIFRAAIILLSIIFVVFTGMAAIPLCVALYFLVSVLSIAL